MSRIYSVYNRNIPKANAHNDVKMTLENTKDDFNAYGIYFIPSKNSTFSQKNNTILMLYNGYWFEVIKKDINQYCNLYTCADFNLSSKLYIYASSKQFSESKSSLGFSNDLNFLLTKLDKHLIQLYANLLQEAGVNITDISEPIIKKERKPRKKTIPPSLKIKVWNKHIGEEIGKSKCLCCKLKDIYQASFSCGHIISENNGGLLIVDNLKPICTSCNSSMGTKNMDDYINEFGF